jgi:septal ring factor EnvC (AmiA/AmiB activator)
MRTLLRPAVLLAFGLLSAGPLAAQQTPEEKQLQELQQRIATIKSSLGSTRKERDGVAGQLQTLEAEISAVQASLRALDGRIAASQQQLGSLQQQSGTLQQQRREQLQQVEGYLRSAQRAGKASTLKLLLNQDDPARGSRLLQYYRYLSQARLQQLGAFRSTLDSMSEVSTDISRTTSTLQAQREQLEAEQTSLALRLQERQSLLDELDIDLQTRSRELSSLEQQQKELETLVEELRQSILFLDSGGADTPFAQRRGKLQWPVEGSVLHNFGSRHELGDLRREGITLAAPAGTPVRAVHHGRVVFADWLGNSGQLLIIDHGDGFMTLYAHNQELRKTEGDWVAAGDVIATVGNTGGQRETALYFEIRRNGKAENPVNWCIARR